jgi:hypothetical protein
MSKFVTGKELADTVYRILFEAKEQLVLVSPYIKLDAYFRQLLDQHAHNPHLALVVVFGKNPGHVRRSVSAEDLAYFTQFPHVTLIYAPTLHAKYYANERMGVVTSINLYDYSFDHNIEFGVRTDRPQRVEKLLRESLQGKPSDDPAFEEALRLAGDHDVVFARRPCYHPQKGLLAKLTHGKDYGEPATLFDALTPLLHNQPYPTRRLSEFPAEVAFSQTLLTTLPERVASKAAVASSVTERKEATDWRAIMGPPPGFCIRTGETIPFNPARPFSYAAYQTWANFGNEDYPERYCHQTGRPSHGRTSKRHPIL